jgi:hypothetical protein
VIVLVREISARQDNNQERDIPQKLSFNKAIIFKCKRMDQKYIIDFLRLYIRFSPAAFSHACAVHPSRPPYKLLSSHCSSLLLHMQARPMTPNTTSHAASPSTKQCPLTSYLRLSLRRPSLPKNLPLSLHLQPGPNTLLPAPSPKSLQGMAINTTTILTSTGI